MKTVLRLAIVVMLLVGVWLTAVSQSTFTNPLLPSGADPFSFYKDGYYYYMHTMGNRLVLWKTKSLAKLGEATKKTIYTPPPNTNYSKQLWAPEIHFIRGKWYVYFAADDGDNKNHRMYVLENSTADPMNDSWEFKGKIGDPTDKWAIDGNVFEYRNKLYMIWSGWEGDSNGRQDIFIAAMSDPKTISSQRVKISSPQFAWEKQGDLNNPNDPPHVDVNEGPQALMNGNKLFLVFSGSGCWTDHYALGLLELKGSDPINPADWYKHAKPVFQSDPENGVYATGHNSFFKSPDGKEDWILYHANSKPGLGCGKFRSPRAQRFTWNPDGTPNFGKPVKEGVALTIPAEK